ncbi:MAG: Hsp70 family protein, partial [Planctomycetota bacterium]
RQDTLRSAELAGIPVAGGGLLDEPVAAFLDYVLTHGAEGILPVEKEQNFLVFDFGGGTCDVAIFRLLPPTLGSAPLAVAPLSVSRYHRLGGGDIDRAIVHEVLIPLLMQQNGLGRFDLFFEDKKATLEPQLMTMAESLKISLCREITRRQKLGIYEDAPKDAVTAKAPGAHPCRLRDREFSLQAPTLSAAQLESVLHPFLDTDLLYTRKTEYRMTCSLFAPLSDALERGDLQPEDIAFCLLVGGSSLIPQVVSAVTSYFPASKILTYPSYEDTQTTVARGAAWHSLCLALFGRGLIDTVSQDEVALRTATGTLALVPKGARLPFPSGPGFSSSQGDLRVPVTALTGTVRLRVEVLAGGERSLFTRVWEIPAPVGKGDPLLLEYRYDE